jgi:hypothetical protein
MDDKQIEQEFLERELTVEQADQPDGILWENLSFNKTSQGKIGAVTNGIGLIVMLLAVLVGILVAAQHQYVKEAYPDPSCPAGRIEK